MELVGKRLAESQNETSSSGNNGDDGSQSAAGRGEDSSMRMVTLTKDCGVDSWGLFIPGFFCNATANVNPDASDRGSSE
ncbi:hypothetical protein M0R45_008085 [Rubus argutus]|uniref:Uncharacterized protein n=1 Tax=Rubus argutus TaxID=59490 RepID=A0AAW1Y3F3_RUBAR